MSLTAALIPSIGPYRVWIGVIALVVGTTYNAVLHLVYERRGRIPSVMPYTDVLACFAFPLMSEAVWVPTLLVLISIIALGAATVGSRSAALVTVLATAGMTLVALIVTPSGAVVGVLGLGIVGVMVVLTVGAVADNERQLRGRFEALVEGLDGIVWEGDVHTFDFTYVSRQAEEMLGYPVADWYTAKFWESHVAPHDRARAVAACLAGEQSGRDHQLEYQMVARDGRLVDLQDIVAVNVDQSGRPVSVHGVIIDVTERRRAEKRVRQYADIVETIQVGLVVLRLDDDDSLRLVAANPAASEAMDRPLEQWTGQDVNAALPILLETNIRHRLGQVVRTGVSFEIDDVVMRPGQSNERVLWLQAFPLPDSSVAVALHDVTQATIATGALRRQALHDSLTGLPNRILLKDSLTQTLAEAARTGADVALLVMDLDRFKEVNDALGHHVGDMLLVELAQRLGHLVRAADMVARLGGDEFALLLTTDVSVPGAVAMAERIQSALLEPFLIDDVQLQTNASIGIAVYPEHATDADSLTQRADVAMYQAKRSGSGHAVYRAELDRSSVRRLTLLSEFRQALESDEFVLHFQPMIDVDTGRTVRAEALVRWLHPKHGLMPPDEFIELAEVSGFIQPLTRWVLDRAITSAATWWNAGHRVGVSVNLSVRNLYDPGLADHLNTLLTRHRFPPGELMLEVTESELMDDPALALEVLRAVNRLGVATGVDDFGTGYSSLTYLRNLPIREIKIDRSFVSGMRQRADDLTIVRSTIDLGHNLSLDVVAEGVEDRQTLTELKTLGCDLAQGFYVSRPLDLTTLRAWLEGPPGDLDVGTRDMGGPVTAR